MINVMRKGNQLIGVYEVIISKEEMLTITDVKKYLVDTLMAELKKDDSSELFTYKILDVSDCTDNDLYGRKCGVVFEFIPNPEMVAELKNVNERLQIGL